MAYIETLAPRGYDPSALFVYPYKEGIRNLSSCPDQPTLCGRIKQAAVGILLLVPLINTIAFMILRETAAVHVFNDDPSVVQTEEMPEEILRLNERRNAAIQQWNLRQGLYEEIARIETEAVDQIEFVHVGAVQAHLLLSAERHPALTHLDGHIYGARYWRAYAEQRGLPSAGFTQVGGVHQYRGGNHLCGYYALFYMYQAVSGRKQFGSRDELHPMLARWTNLIAKKRAMGWLSNHRNEQIPVALKVSVRGITRDDMQYLIDNDPKLECLRTTDNCFVLGMDDFRFQHEEKQLWDRQQREMLERGTIEEITPYPVNVIHPLGNRRLIREFPLYFIMRESDMHYYFVWAETPWEFQVVHSLGSSIHNSDYFSEDTFFDIVECLFTEIE